MGTPHPAIPLAACALALLFAGGARATPCQLTDLRWMTGIWRDDAADTRSEERWVAGPADQLMGSSWALHTDRPGGVVEAETIQVGAAGAVTLTLRHFTADLARSSEEKAAPMVFAAADCEAEVVVFNGQGAHAGERITYRRAGDVLTFTGDFLHGGTPVQVVISFTRTGD
jgi:Domain of unknown function (DUF6265)